MMVYVLFDQDYHHYFEGVFSSEKEACQAIADKHPYSFGSYGIEAIEIDSNTKGSISNRTKAFLDWYNDDPFYNKWTGDGEFPYNDYEMQAIIKAVVNEFFS